MAIGVVPADAPDLPQLGKITLPFRQPPAPKTSEAQYCRHGFV